jgi:hypothetical protein
VVEARSMEPSCQVLAAASMGMTELQVVDNKTTRHNCQRIVKHEPTDTTR